MRATHRNVPEKATADSWSSPPKEQSSPERHGGKRLRHAAAGDAIPTGGSIIASASCQLARGRSPSTWSALDASSSGHTESRNTSLHNVCITGSNSRHSGEGKLPSGGEAKRHRNRQQDSSVPLKGTDGDCMADEEAIGSGRLAGSGEKHGDADEVPCSDHAYDCVADDDGGQGHASHSENGCKSGDGHNSMPDDGCGRAFSAGDCRDAGSYDSSKNGRVDPDADQCWYYLDPQVRPGPINDLKCDSLQLDMAGVPRQVRVCRGGVTVPGTDVWQGMNDCVECAISQVAVELGVRCVMAWLRMEDMTALPQLIVRYNRLCTCVATDTSQGSLARHE